eukprot:SAG31_NODE_2528_length_5557_cov_10.897948_2_plen_143_part_00
MVNGKLYSTESERSDLFARCRLLQSHATGTTVADSSLQLTGQYEGRHGLHRRSNATYGRLDRHREHRKLHFAEKIAVRGSELIARSPRARLVVLVYASVLHFLVLCTLYRLQICAFEKANLQIEIMKDEEAVRRLLEAAIDE